MLYKIAHILRDRFPILWDLVDILNSLLFNIRYGAKLKVIEAEMISKYSMDSGFKVVRLRDVDASVMANMFAQQPPETYCYFKPHGFDAKSLEKLQKIKAFLAYVLIDGNSGIIAAYCFNRSFFHGKGFRGRMVDVNYRGKGLGTLMNKMLNDIGFGIGLRLYETVSKDNVASYKSAISASNFKVIEELPHNELYLEILPD